VTTPWPQRSKPSPRPLKNRFHFELATASVIDLGTHSGRSDVSESLIPGLPKDYLFIGALHLS
jgi:hypothetical protein